MFFRNIYTKSATHAKTIFHNAKLGQYATNYMKATFYLTLAGGAIGGCLGLVTGIVEYFIKLDENKRFNKERVKWSDKVELLGSCEKEMIVQCVTSGVFLGSFPITYPAIKAYGTVNGVYNKLLKNHSKESTAIESLSDVTSAPKL